MMHPHTGAMVMLPQDFTPLDMQHARQQIGDEAVLVHGTQADIEAMATRVRLGDAELAKRKARRQQQKASRRRNR